MAAKKNGITDTEDSLVEVLQREKIRHLLASELFIVKPGTEVKEVVDLMHTQGVGCILVGSKKKLQGIFTERDYLEKIAGHQEILNSPIDEFMSKNPVTLEGDDSVKQLIRVIVDGGYRHLPVIDGGKCIGVVDSINIFKFIADLFPSEIYNLPPSLNQVASDVEGA
tara:strand:+ start:52 stop:552 length:501 start_codon:yes stop_codon:yes gene_type:complete